MEQEKNLQISYKEVSLKASPQFERIYHILGHIDNRMFNIASISLNE